MGEDGSLREKSVGHQRQFSLFLISLKPSLEMPFKKTSCDSLAWVVYNAGLWEKAHRSIVSFIIKNTLPSIQQLSYCNLSSHQSSRH